MCFIYSKLLLHHERKCENSNSKGGGKICNKA